MIRIDHISFGFAVPGEDFARSLYADWDGFCRHCFERVAEECLAPYGNDKALYELERLDLDLGSIPEEDFYDEYPRRLMEALLAALPPLYGTRMQPDLERTAAARIDNLLHYLKYGHPQPEWADKTFDPQEETDWLAGQPTAFYYSAIEKLAALCAEDRHAMRRLLWQTAGGKLLLDLYTAVLALPSAGLQEKRRFLSLLLEAKPDIPLRFVHGTQDGNGLHGMAELLDSPSVRTLMREETGEHAEVDLPPYWHYLYEWLIRYYPFNGLAIFGGKAEFTRHLHHRLLTFIRKRNYSFYLSKAELTVSFLLEVFGPAYYIDVLNAIYELQPHNPDGSPIYDNYFNRELYRMFLRLSLLRLPEAAQEGAATNESQEKTKEIQGQAGPGAVTALLTDIGGLAAILKDPARSDAYKRMLWTMLVREQPEAAIRWLPSACAKDNTLLPLLAELAEDATVSRLLGAYSLAVFEAWGNIRNYLETHRDSISWLKGIPEPQRASAFQLSALHLLASGTPGQADDVKNILRLIYREVTGGDKNEDAAVDTLARELEEAGSQTAFHEREASTGKHSITLQDLRRIMHDPDLSETAKRRAVASYWDYHREHTIEAVRLLQEQGMLDEVLERTGHYAWEILLFRTLRQAVGMEKASALMPLFQWLAGHETALSSYRAGNGHSLPAGLLLGIARWEQDGRNKPLPDAVRSLLVSLFRKDGLPFIGKQLVQETASETAGEADTEQLFALLNAAFDLSEEETSDNPFSQSGTLTASKWHFGILEVPLREGIPESRWNTAESFATWLEDTSVPIAAKREQLRKAAQEKPQAWLQLLRALPQESRASASLENLMTVQDLLQAVAKVNFHQAAILSQAIERLQHPATHLPASLARGSISLDALLRKALLAYLQDPETWDRTWGEKDITDTFLHCLRLAATGKEPDDTDNRQWRQLAETITHNYPEADSQPQENLLETLADPSATHAVLRQTLARLMDKHPEAFRAWMEQEAGTDSLTRMAEATDYIQASHWADELARTPGFAHPGAFRRLTGWLLQRAAVRELAAALFFYVREPNWQTFTPEQMEAYFFSRMYGSTDALPDVEALTDKSLPEDTRKRLFRRLLRHRPGKLLAFLREATSRNVFPLDEWLRVTDASDWLHLAASLSLGKAELLRQITDCLSLPEEERKKALATYIVYGDTGEWPYATPQETVCGFIGMLPSLQDADTGKKEETVRRVEAELALPETEAPAPEELPEALTVGNAGLCLLAPWFVRLFAMLGWLDEERKKFRSTASKVRAVFLLQYLAYGEEKAWREAELAFNRLLTALPGHVPLPKSLPLADEERQTADGMVAGVKANWPQMNGTSVEGFRGSFILRGGTLEQEEERWLLTVEEKAYDLLLETVPWGFRQIRLPWLKKYVQVKWHEKQEF